MVADIAVRPNDRFQSKATRQIWRCSLSAFNAKALQPDCLPSAFLNSGINQVGHQSSHGFNRERWWLVGKFAQMQFSGDFRISDWSGTNGAVANLFRKIVPGIDGCTQAGTNRVNGRPD